MNAPKLFLLSIVDPEDSSVNWIKSPNLDSPEILDLSLRENLSLYMARIQLIANGLKNVSSFSDDFIISNNYDLCIKYKNTEKQNNHKQLEEGTYYISKESEELFSFNMLE